jgi:hypothetical protein
MAKTGIVTRALWRVESWERVANGSFFLSLDTTPTLTVTLTVAENLRGGLHAVTGSTGNDAVLAASARAVRHFSYSCGVMKLSLIDSKRKIGKGHLKPCFGK